MYLFPKDFLGGILIELLLIDNQLIVFPAESYRPEKHFSTFLLKAPINKHNTLIID